MSLDIRLIPNEITVHIMAAIENENPAISNITRITTGSSLYKREYIGLSSTYKCVCLPICRFLDTRCATIYAAPKYASAGNTEAAAIRMYLTPKISAIINAPAPIIGGISCPPVDATDSKEPASSGEYPAFFISGIVYTPVPATLATAEPETIPISPEHITAAFAGPPVSLLESLRPRSKSTLPPPQPEKKVPNTRK